MKQCLVAALFLLLFFTPFVQISAQQNLLPEITKEETREAKVTAVISEEQKKPQGAPTAQLYQKLELEITSGPDKGKKFIVENGEFATTSVQKFAKGDTVIVSLTTVSDNSQIATIVDFVRRDVLSMLFVLFLLVVAIVGKRHGIASLVGMGISFIIIFAYILPNIYQGGDPIVISILGAMLIVPLTFYLSHGINKKTTVAIIGTILSLTITGLLAALFIHLAKFTGFSSEEANFIQSLHQGQINIKGLLLAGIIISGIGILDDVTISQAAIVEKLRQTSPSMSLRGLYNNATEIGHDHIASVVNTLILVYTGSALPLLVLFMGNTRPFAEVINYELIAEEILKTLVASIGLILAVPITTLLAVFSYHYHAPSEKNHNH